MKKIIIIILLITLLIPLSRAQKLPEGYILQYQQDFIGINSLSDFKFNDPASWGIFKASGNFYLQFSKNATFEPSSSLPNNIAVLNNRIFGDFIFETNFMLVPDTNGFGEVCLFLGLKDLTKYYYIQLANLYDSLNSGIFVVKNSVVRQLANSNKQTVAWKENKWHKIRIERNIVKRTIVVYIDDMAHPALQAKDYEFVMGYVGIGSHVNTNRFDNIRIWAPTVIPQEFSN